MSALAQQLECVTGSVANMLEAYPHMCQHEGNPANLRLLGSEGQQQLPKAQCPSSSLQHQHNALLPPTFTVGYSSELPDTAHQQKEEEVGETGLAKHRGVAHTSSASSSCETPVATCLCVLFFVGSPVKTC